MMDALQIAKAAVPNVQVHAFNEQPNPLETQESACSNAVLDRCQ